MRSQYQRHKLIILNIIISDPFFILPLLKLLLPLVFCVYFFSLLDFDRLVTFVFCLYIQIVLNTCLLQINVLRRFAASTTQKLRLQLCNYFANYYTRLQNWKLCQQPKLPNVLLYISNEYWPWTAKIHLLPSVYIVVSVCLCVCVLRFSISD